MTILFIYNGVSDEIISRILYTDYFLQFAISNRRDLNKNTVILF